MIRLITEAQPVSAAVHCSSEQRLCQPRAGLRDDGCVWFEEHSAHAERLLYKSWNKDPEPFHHVMGNNTLLAATWQWLKKKCPDALLLLFKLFVVVLLFFGFFFNSPPGLTIAHSYYSSCSAQWVSLFSCTEPKQQVCGVCMKSWDTFRAAFGDQCSPGSSARLPSAASGTEGKLPWGACAAGSALPLR